MFKILPFLLFLLTSCYNSKLDNKIIQEMEREDDNLCMMEGVEFGNNNIKSTYWECRLRIIDQRIANFATRPGYSMFYKIEMQKLRIIIQERAKTEIEKLEKQAENSFEEKEHTFCILVSNKEARIDTNSNSENISYLKCREIMESKRVKEKGNIVFSNEEFIENERKKERKIIEKKDNFMEIGNNCIQYANNTKYLNECLSKLETVERCYESIDNIMSKREIDDKLFCIVSSRQQYPDVLAKYDERDRKKGNIGPKISIEELLELRDAYIEKCNRNRYLKLPLYREYLKQECNKLYIIKKGT